MSQDELGVLIDKGKSAISQYESGRTAMTTTLLYMICEHLKCSASWVFTGEGSMTGNIDNSNSFTMRNMKGNGNTAGINNTTTPSIVDEKCQQELEKTRERYYNLETKYQELVDRLLSKS